MYISVVIVPALYNRSFSSQHGVFVVVLVDVDILWRILTLEPGHDDATCRIQVYGFKCSP
jgi:hypothetical protein